MAGPILGTAPRLLMSGIWPLTRYTQHHGTPMGTISKGMEVKGSNYQI